MAQQTYLVLHQTGTLDKDTLTEREYTHAAAYKMANADGTGDLIETVDFMADGIPNWDEGGFCDPHRGGDPELQKALVAVLQRPLS